MTQWTGHEHTAWDPLPMHRGPKPPSQFSQGVSQGMGMGCGCLLMMAFVFIILPLLAFASCAGAGSQIGNNNSFSNISDGLK